MTFGGQGYQFGAFIRWVYFYVDQFSLFQFLQYILNRNMRKINLLGNLQDA